MTVLRPDSHLHTKVKISFVILNEMNSYSMGPLHFEILKLIVVDNIFMTSLSGNVPFKSLENKSFSVERLHKTARRTSV